MKKAAFLIGIGSILVAISAFFFMKSRSCDEYIDATDETDEETEEVVGDVEE